MLNAQVPTYLNILAWHNSIHKKWCTELMGQLNLTKQVVCL